ncbi:DUF4282 domain-containing protein [Desulfococcus sp.]|uniref:DUF4282 domain-containing protein n=1 Tax=Desulfococcus sp. TaxID=2025834 RepID=UPI003593E117
MKINCPECLTEHHVEDAEIPDAGMRVRCRICGTTFQVARETPVEAAYDLGEDEMVCPKCFITQKKSDTCMCCGLIISKYREEPPRPEERQQQEQPQRAEVCVPMPEAPAAGGRGAHPPPPPGGGPGPNTPGELVRGLFDLSFNRLITPGMIKGIYGFLLIFGGAVALILLNFFVFSAKNHWAAIATLLAYLFAVVVVRIQAEFLIVFFRIERNTRKDDK